MSGLDIRIGHDKQPAPVVPSNQPLYNLQTGQVLTDSGGTILVSEQNITLSSEAVSSKATSIVFTDEGKTFKQIDYRLTGKNFFILNDSILSIEVINPGGGFVNGGDFVLSSDGDGNGVVTYIVDSLTGSLSSIIPKTGSSGSNYVAGTQFTIPSPSGQPLNNAVARITGVGTLVSGEGTKFTSELQIKNKLVLPTGELVGVVTGKGVPAIVSAGNSYNQGDIVKAATGDGLVIRVDSVGNGQIASYTIIQGGKGYVTGTVTLNTGTASGSTPAQINIIASTVPANELRSVSSVQDDSTVFLSLAVTNQKPLVSVGVGKFSGVGAIYRRDTRQVDPVLPIEEQFPLFSEVSSSILGIPKAETQLGLFSNVSTYGLDNDDFLFYSTDPSENSPFEWVTRRNREYGKHYRSTYIEGKEESAIIIGSYPQSYSYSYPPGPSSTTSVTSTSHKKFCNFIKLGMLLYDYFKPTSPSPARGDGAATSGLTDTGYALNFFPYVASFASTDLEYVLGDDPRITNKQFPYYDNNEALISPFLAGENIYYIGDTVDGVPKPGVEPIGTLRTYSLFDGTIHFNEDVGFLWTEWKNRPGTTNDTYFTVIGETSKSTVNINGDMQFKSPGLMFRNLVFPLNQAYNTFGDLCNQCDTLETSWKKLNRLQLTIPGQGLLTPNDVENLPDIVKYIIGIDFGIGLTISPINDSLPGAGPASVSRAFLISRKAFRYQPGRISGYTFGVRASGDATTNAVRLEWGISNDTDELVFQVEGANINIVRRSVVPLSDSVMERNILNPGSPDFKTFRESTYADILTDENTSVAQKIDAIEPYFDGDQIITTLDSNNDAQGGGDSTFSGLIDKPVFETKIPRDLWNGDPLNGNGPSGWNLKIEDVTMYKIEFGWYGAIGVKFYVYVPVNNNEARWVAVHTLVIENSIGRPSMGDPYFKFKYAVVNEGPASVDTPQFVYKYGTSCYIDGGDDGTIKVNSVTSEPKIAPTETTAIDPNTGLPDPNAPSVTRSTTVVGLLPKTVIYNSLGKVIKNKQSIYPRELSLTANGLTEISLVKCVACPGFAHTYQTNVSSGYVGDERYFELLRIGTDGNGDAIYDYGTPDYINQQQTVAARFEISKLGRQVSLSSGSNLVNVLGFADVNGEPDKSQPFTSGNRMRFLRIGDVIDPDRLIWTQSYLLSQGVENCYITDINLSNNTFTTNIPSPSSSTGTPLTIQPLLFFELDYNAKVIAEKVWLTYLDIPFPGTTDFAENSGITYSSQIKIGDTYKNAIGVTLVSLWTVNENLIRSLGGQVFEAIQYKVPRALQKFERFGDSEVRQTTYRYPCRLSQYKSIAASTFPVYGKDNSILALIPRNVGSVDNGSFSSNQRADFRLGITPFKPTQASPNSPIQWERPATGEVISQENFTEQYKLYAERFAEALFRDAEGFEISEYDYGRVPVFTVDYRIPDPPGTNSGRCSYCNITVGSPEINFVQQIPASSISSVVDESSGKSIAELFADVNSTFDANAYYLRKAGGPFLDYNAQGGEIGYNNLNPSQNGVDFDDPDNIPQLGSGVRFASDFVTYTISGQGQFTVVKLSGTNVFNNLTGRLVNATNATDVYIYNIPVFLESFRRLSKKSFDFNPYPLYFFMEMRDNCRINSPTIREFSQVQNTYNPRWIGSPSVTLENGSIDGQLLEVGEIGQTSLTTGDQESSPPNFTSENRLSSALVDTQSTSQLRPYEVVDRFYVGGNLGNPADGTDDQYQTKQLDLSMIFGPQRETITPDLLNTTAYFFVATSRDIANTTIAGTLNYIEQQ
jgi:hypothetical protein